MNLRFLPLVFASVLLVFVVFFSFFVNRPAVTDLLLDITLRNIKQHLVLKGEEIQEQLVNNNIAQIRQWASMESAFSTTVHALVVNDHGVIVASGDIRQEGASLNEILPSVHRRAMEWLSQTGFRMSVETRNDYAFAFVPIRIFDEVGRRKNDAGFIYLERDLSNQRQALTRHISKINFWALLVFGLISAWFILTFNRKVTQRFNHLKGATSEYLRGNHQARVAVENVGEFEDIAKSINHMLDGIEHQETLIADQKRYIDSVYAATIEGIIVMSEGGTILDVNERALEMFGYENAGHMIGQPIEMLMPDRYRSTHHRHVEEHIESGRHPHIVNTIRKVKGLRQDGEQFPIEIVISEIQLNSDRRFVGFVRDVTLEVESRKAIERLAYTNQVTGLVNRNGLEEYLSNFKRDQVTDEHEHWMFCMVGVDHMRDINTNLGYGVGDKLLATLAQSLQRVFSDFRIVAHLGSDRFLLGKPRNTQTLSIQFSDFVDRLFSKHMLSFKLDENDVNISVSVGAIEADISDDIMNIQHNADLALGEAKKETIEHTYLLEEKDLSRIALNAQICRNLLPAISDNELALVFQPKISIDNHQPVSAECLVRWFPASGEPIPPSVFIPIAEAANLIDKLEHWVLDKACAYLANWQSQGIKMHLAVNISAKQFRSEGFVEYVQSVIDRHQISTQSLELEITEYSIVSDIEIVHEHILSLYGLGISVSIDDFGTGQSNLATLLELPIRHIKIDRSFVRSSLESKKGYDILNGMVNLGRQLDITLTAEGVETQEELDCVTAMGCHQVQGFFFAKPMAEKEFLEYYLS